MNVLYILSINNLDGATLSALSIIKGLIKGGHKVVAFLPKWGRGPLLDVLDSLGVKYYRDEFYFKSYPPYKSIKSIFKFPLSIIKREYKNRRARNNIVEIISKENIDIIHTNVGPVHIGYEAAKKAKIPHIWHIREYGDLDFNIHQFPSKSFFRNRLRDSYVITITRALFDYNQLDKSNGAYVIYNGVKSIEEAFFDSCKKKYFLCASRVSQEKGFDQILRVFARFLEEKSDYKLIILGSGSPAYIEKMKKYCRELGIENSVCFEGFKTNVLDYMRYVKALLVASPSEGFGRMTAEASFAGCIVIGKNTAGTKEVLDITGGYRFISDDEFLDCMHKVDKLSDEEYKKKALFSQKAALSYFSEEQYVKNVLNVYEIALHS